MSMATCSLGTTLNLSKLELHRDSISISLKRSGIRTFKGQHLEHVPLTIPKRLKNRLTLCCVPASENKSLVSSRESGSSSLTSHLIPNSYEIESLLEEICETNSIANFELKLDGFRLCVTRNLAGNVEHAPSPTPETVTSNMAPDVNGSASTPSLAITRTGPSTGNAQMLIDKASDGSLTILQSPRVGFFRRSRSIKGKRAPPACKEKQVVKESQVLCYIEQLGGELPLESDVSGEVIEILREDGDPVGYGDALIAILPSFPRI